MDVKLIMPFITFHKLIFNLDFDNYIYCAYNAGKKFTINPENDVNYY